MRHSVHPDLLSHPGDSWYIHIPLADPGGGAREDPPHWVQFLSFSCSFRGTFGQIIGWHPYLRGWHPIWEILDAPLHKMKLGICYVIFATSFDWPHRELLIHVIRSILYGKNKREVFARRMCCFCFLKKFGLNFY